MSVIEMFPLAAFSPGMENGVGALEQTSKPVTPEMIPAKSNVAPNHRSIWIEHGGGLFLQPIIFSRYLPEKCGTKKVCHFTMGFRVFETHVPKRQNWDEETIVEVIAHIQTVE